jgi:hypothetical protein
MAFRQFDDMLKQQIDHIVHQKYESVQVLVEKQVKHNETLSKLEDNFKKTLNHLCATVGLQDSKRAVKELVEFAEDADRILKERTAMTASLEQAQHRQLQLLQLIQFGQQHINDTLQAIQNLAARQETRYGNDGKRVPANPGKMLNQQV